MWFVVPFRVPVMHFMTAINSCLRRLQNNGTDLMMNERVVASGQGSAEQQRRETDKIEKLSKFKEVTPDSMNSTYEDYKHFFDEYGSRLVSWATWKKKISEETPEQWCSPQLEAYGLVLIQNYKELVKKRMQGMRRARALFTVNGTDARKNQGWTKDGMQAYNDLLVEVKERRRKAVEEGNSHARKYLEEKQEEKKKKSEKNALKKKETVENREKDYPALEDNTWEQDIMDRVGICV